MVELHGRSHPVCHSCSGKISRLQAIPNTIPGIRDALARERRATERRDEQEDQRIFPRERRVDDRRAAPRSVDGEDTARFSTLAAAAGADAAADAGAENAGAAAADLHADFVDVVIELAEGDIEAAEQTVVREQS